ncbi:conserved hypothetical protein [Vibrio crassostreae]|nr:conserved hypothetical protein [Vibrio crassostreae]CAK2808062.1 conserved hypothetical protein [Vibrio crassostreae]CAK3288644.1 conserved hypothetical protein [Vibrio crassostreae]CAK3849058.1 conserved hypothetical protein [Vibrio crassostreae]
MIVVRFALLAVMLFGFQKMIALSGFDDAELDEQFGQLSGLMKPFVDKELIDNKAHSVGVFESAKYLETSLLEPVSTQISTSKGDFMVIGAVSGLKGQQVSVTGLEDSRLEAKLCIESECFKLRNAPSLVETPR